MQRTTIGISAFRSIYTIFNMYYSTHPSLNGPTTTIVERIIYMVVIRQGEIIPKEDENLLYHPLPLKTKVTSLFLFYFFKYCFVLPEKNQNI